MLTTLCYSIMQYLSRFVLRSSCKHWRTRYSEWQHYETHNARHHIWCPPILLHWPISYTAEL